MEAVAPSTDCALSVAAEVELVPLDTKLSQSGDGGTLVGMSRQRLYLKEVSSRGPAPLLRGGAVVADAQRRQATNRSTRAQSKHRLHDTFARLI
jgi:hypothetical protein